MIRQSHLSIETTIGHRLGILTLDLCLTEDQYGPVREGGAAGGVFDKDRIIAAVKDRPQIGPPPFGSYRWDWASLVIDDSVEISRLWTGGFIPSRRTVNATLRVPCV